MRQLSIILCFLLMSFASMAQSDCESAFRQDTMFIPKEQRAVNGEYVEATLKNLSVVRLFKSNEGKFYMKLLVTEDFYFDKTDVLEIRSGSKSYYAKDTKQYKVNKTTGLYVIEIYKNYIATLKEDGITSIVFSHAETDFTRQDASLVRKMARCFYDAAFVKK